jgi:Mn2+/Fe2+ NRAMP family transporter
VDGAGLAAADGRGPAHLRAHRAGQRPRPGRRLFLSAVVNGLLAPPLLVLVMLVANNRTIMGPHGNGAWLNGLGWTATAAMTAAAVAFVVTAR